MTFEFYDVQGKELSWRTIKTANVTTPVIEHVYATVRERVLGSGGEVDKAGNSC